MTAMTDLAWMLENTSGFLVAGNLQLFYVPENGTGDCGYFVTDLNTKEVLFKSQIYLSIALANMSGYLQNIDFEKHNNL